MPVQNDRPFVRLFRSVSVADWAKMLSVMVVFIATIVVGAITAHFDMRERLTVTSQVLNQKVDRLSYDVRDVKTQVRGLEGQLSHIHDQLARLKAVAERIPQFPRDKDVHHAVQKRESLRSHWRRVGISTMPSDLEPSHLVFQPDPAVDAVAIQPCRHCGLGSGGGD